MDKKKRVHLFNCDNTYNLLVVEALLRSIGDKLPFNITISKHNFSLHNMSEICENTISRLQIDFAFFVVHANESRLSINENNVDIGYTRVYRALLKATGDKVVVVIGGDSHYKNEAEETHNVLSRWALRIVNLQFKEEFRDGRKSFVFSWDEKHRAIHEDALLHFFDPNKTGLKFAPLQSTSEMVAKPNLDAATAFTEKSLDVLDIHENRREHESRRMAAKRPQEQAGRCVKEKRGTADVIILCNDESTATVVSHMYCLPSMRPPPDVHIGSPSELKLHLAVTPVTVCAIGLLASDLKETALKSKWEKSAFADLLRTAQRATEKKVVVVICKDRNAKELVLSQSEEMEITDKVELILQEKGVVLWCRGRSRESESRTVGAANLDWQYVEFPNMEQKEDPQTDTSKETLMLKTAIRFGDISYKASDVVERKRGWNPPHELVSDLKHKWKNVPRAELEIYSERESGNLRAVVRDSLVSRMMTGYTSKLLSQP
ncbi:hypothetical protein ACROYT_G027457 [Oculina patagonica]